MRRALHLLTAALLVVTAAAAVLLVVPVLRGEPSRLVIVSGHSMDPTFHTGDLVLAWPAEEYRVGDVAPYRVPQGEPGEGGLVIHRIVGGDARTGFVMQGDNNPSPDVWTPRPEDIIGRQVLMVPRVGELLAWLRQPVVLAALIAGLVTASVVSTTLAPQRSDDDGESDDGAAQDAPPDLVIDLRTPTPTTASRTDGATTPAARGESRSPSARTHRPSPETVGSPPAPGSD